MFQTKTYIKTKRDVSEGMSNGQAILEKGGYVLPTDIAGVVSYQPMGLKLKEVVKATISQELGDVGFSDVELPILQSKELWESSGRWSTYLETKTAFTLADGREREMLLAPTAEEAVIALAMQYIQGHNSLPVKLHQIGPKFRNEIRCRGGLQRGKQFDMSDAYSFHSTLKEMIETYGDVKEAYLRTFEKFGLKVLPVEADSGTIGGDGSTEMMYETEHGEDVLIVCDSCNYGANAEKAISIYISTPSVNEDDKEFINEHTPNIRTVEQLLKYFAADPTQMVKTVIFKATGAKMDHVAVCIRGDLEINTVKLANAIGALEVEPADAEDVQRITGAEVGFAGPIGLKIQVLFDASTEGMKNFIAGVNETDRHGVNICFGRDLEHPSKFFDLALAAVGHKCAKCSDGYLRESRGIELGHIFQLGTVYTEAMGVSFTDQNGEKRFVEMGCYGIGVSRLIQVLAENYAESDSSVVWSPYVAPYKVHVLAANRKDACQAEVADTIERRLEDAGISTLNDDRIATFGQRMADADLIGSPLRIIAGRGAQLGKVEVINRMTRQSTEHSIEDAIKLVCETLAPRPTQS